jgi:hypothetical protein
MPSATTTEQSLHAWGVWSRVDVNIGPEVDHAAGSAEGMWRSPQCWDERRPKVVLLCDDDAMKVEKAVLGTGIVLAAALRSFYIRQHPPRTRAQVQVLLEAQRRVGVLLGAGCATGAPERPQGRAADAGAISASPEQF